LRPISRLESKVATERFEGPQLRVLIIDDDGFVGAAIEAMLTRYNCSAVHAANVQTGLQLFEASAFDVVIIDIFMPETDGLEAIKTFRARAENVHLVAMTGFRFSDVDDSSLDFLGMASRAGANRCLRKPFMPQQLIAAVDPSLDPSLADSEFPPHI
jgi:CheY-like chemotaxis protein